MPIDKSDKLNPIKEQLRRNIAEGKLPELRRLFNTKNEAIICSRPGCDNPMRDVVDGDRLCQKHCEEWAKGEGEAFHGGETKGEKE